MKKTAIAFLAANLLVSSAIYAQTVLKGTVVGQDGKPIPGGFHFLTRRHRNTNWAKW
ncbi:exported hypothetical protein [Sphingobacterium sp. PM2-P1-29]|nr:exported hypothetical protein [Sphingobacterium sp. PM2-P1-29]